MEDDYSAEVCPQCGAPVRDTGSRTICTYCGASLVRGKPTVPGNRSGWGVQLKLVRGQDPLMEGIEAFRLLIPQGWDWHGGVQWRMNNPAMPAAIVLCALNPHGLESFEVFPSIPCTWSSQGMVQGFFPPGSMYLGNEVRQPASAIEVLRDLVVPRHRYQFSPVLVQEEHLPELPEQLRRVNPISSGAITEADGGRIRIRYGFSDQVVEEDFFGVVEVAKVLIPTMLGAMEQIYWVADYLFSTRAVEGQLERLADGFLAIVRSFRLNPVWFNRYMQVSHSLVQNQIQQIQHVGQLSRIISQTQDQISDSIMASYQERQSTMDRLSTQFSQAIRGVDEYIDPSMGESIELPGGYEHAWCNPLGEYVLTDDPFFDPNLDSSLDWERMKRS